MAVVIDLYDRKVVGFAMSDSIDAELANTALKQTVAMRKLKAGVLYHSDRGSTYAAGDHQKIVTGAGMTMSMSGKGNLYDNAVAESLMCSFKKEEIYDKVFETRDKAKVAVFGYVNGYFNTERLHSYNGYKSPNQAEKDYYQLNK